MKKLIVALSLVLFLIASTSFALIWSDGKTLTTTGVAYAYPCYISALVIKTDGTEDVSVIVYDNASAASGDKIWDTTVKGSDNYGGRIWSFPRKVNNGLYVAVTTSGTTVIIVEWVQER